MDGEEETRSSYSWNTSWGIFLIYRKLLPNLSPISGRNLLFLGIIFFPYLGLFFSYQGLILPYQRLFLREVWDLETRKFVNKYPLRISRLYLFINNELTIYERMAGWGTKNSRLATLSLTFGETTLLLQTSFRILPSSNTPRF